ncbi:MAG TPA: hypothetical protein VFU12_11670 [Glycomyces sp.]|nr:hypothetical protein [Glycomyces sp.]
MRRRGSDQVGRWPWGVWLALVGVSAGTVASFAGVGWAFLHAAGIAEDAGEAAPLAWDQDEVVIEAEEPPDGDRGSESGSAAEGTEPSTKVLWEPEPEAATPEEPTAPSGPVLEPTPETAEEAPQLVPVEPDAAEPEEERALVPIEPPDDGDGPSDGEQRPSLLPGAPNMH